MAKLGDICALYSGTGFPVQYQGNSTGQYPFYKVGDIAKNVIQGLAFLSLCENYIDEDVCKLIKGTIIPQNTIVFAKIGEAVKLNRRAITTAPCLIDNNAMGIQPNEDYLNLGYFYHFMCNLKLEQYAEATTVPSVKKTVIEKIDIPLPPLSTQKQIAANLDKATQTIDLCNAILEKLDLLVKARFVEMFCDCKNRVSMADLCSIITDGTHQPPKFQLTGIPFILVSNLSENKVTYNTEKYISDETYEELYKRTPIEKGDILLSTVGSYGHPAVVVEDTKFLFQRHIAYLKPRPELINSIYLHSAILSSDIQKQIEERVKGIAQKTLNLSEIRKITVPVPNMDLQTQFADFVKQIDKSKFAVQQVLAKAETLKKALMQEYFG